MPPEDNGERFRARVYQKVIDNSEGNVQDWVKFLVRLGDKEADELITYARLCDYLEEQIELEDAMEGTFKFNRIVDHYGPMKPDDPRYKGSSYNVMLEWSTGEITEEPLGMVGNDDAVTCAMYARDHGLLNTKGWKQFKRYVKNHKVFTRAINQTKLRQARRMPKYKFGVEVPKSYNDAMRLDTENGNNKWQEAIDTEMGQIIDYKTFIDKGKVVWNRDGKGPVGVSNEYQRVRVHLIFDVKHDGRFKARLVADGSQLAEPVEGVYLGVVSLKSLRLVIFLAELNQLELWGADVGNAYLESYTSEKLYVIAGPEFGEQLCGHLLIMSKALYGTKTAGKCWHHKFEETLTNMGFHACKSDTDVWMKKVDNHWEYVAVYVDDLCLAMKDPAEFVRQLREDHGYKLKGDGVLSYHLGAEYVRDKDGTLGQGSKRYIDKMQDSYERFFGQEAVVYVSPLEKGDHPELDDSEFCDGEGIAQYQTMIGQLQWVVALGRFDVFTATMSMSRWRVAPRIGHLNRLKRLYGYLKGLNDGRIRFRVEEPDMSGLPEDIYSWEHSVYGNCSEEIPDDLPEALGKPVVFSTSIDTNLYHGMITG